MAKVTAKPSVTEAPSPSAETRSEEVAAQEPPAPKTAVKVTFGRWFASKKKFKPHWAAGMQAFTDTTAKRTVEEWDQIFKNY